MPRFFKKFYTIFNSCTILAQLAELIVHKRLKAVCVCACVSVCLSVYLCVNQRHPNHNG